MENSPLIELGLPLALAVIMIGMGLSLRPADFRQVAVRPLGLAWGTFLQLVLLPACAFALAHLLKLPPLIAVGLVILAACPGGTTSNLITYLARGDLALSIALTVVASSITIVSLPFLANIALAMFAGADEAVELPMARTVLMLAAITVVPVCIGMLVKARWPGVAAAAERAVGLFGALVLATLIVLIAWQLWDRLPSLLARAGPACVALNLIGIAAGLLATRVPGLPREQALTIAIELGIKNGTLGLLVAMTLLDSPEMAVPSAIYGLLMYGFGIAIIFFGRRQQALKARAGDFVRSR
ncbi:bile acid:sodium symporter family protein [Marilutibacter alkalisoli]|uniref:Bile acid:sodium symporter family protein n=1 Tax=Marilutibacter alkalisoli TaxID=2591633 RepID=A0A514BVK5_9GAMM|nr:bile acid:sodium symporter family protein [Lysobacter alkalisoli]QDH71418.1 bile acid:sodium symporter family protein [Lysobacter alkalisoli]